MKTSSLPVLLATILCGVLLMDRLSMRVRAGEPIFRPTGIHVAGTHKTALIESVEAVSDHSADRATADPATENPATRLTLSKDTSTRGHLEAPVARDYSAYRPWYEIRGGVRHSTSDRHLIEAHGVSAEELVGLSQDQKDRLHGIKHGELKHGELTHGTARGALPVYQTVSQPVVFQPVVVQSVACPGGVCPVQSLQTFQPLQPVQYRYRRHQR